MASCIIRAHCGKCNKTWDIYWRDVNADTANICPYCGEEIDRVIWDRDVTHAAAAVLDANMELEKDATGYQKPLFSITFINRRGNYLPDTLD